MGQIYLRNFEFIKGEMHTTREVVLPAKRIDKASAIFIQFQETMEYGKVDNLLKINKDGQQSYLKRQGEINSTFKFNVAQKDSHHFSHIYGTIEYDLQTMAQTFTEQASKLVYQVIFHLNVAGEDMGQQGIYLEYTNNEGDNYEGR